MLSTFLFSRPFLCHRGMNEDCRILCSKQQSHYYTSQPYLHIQTVATAGGPQICKYHLHVSVIIFWVLIRICYTNSKRIANRKIISGCRLQLKSISIIHCRNLILQHREIARKSPHLLFKLISVCLVQVLTLLLDASVKK